ncbi:MAG: tRNA (adenosine(37)-N6)-threonylcarbamoyltransferase complex transferase subunit TsaD [Verrucomicrobiia bacterium]
MEIPPAAHPILAVETSCDETAVALLTVDHRYHHSVISSQIPDHRPYGGVVPELASRNHLRLLGPLCDQIITRAALPLRRISAVAATRGPGLSGALLTGFHFGKGLSIALNVPFFGINHMEGHLLSSFYGSHIRPAISLIVSGGHTMLVKVEGRGRYRVLERTRDDAAGEAFDKVARLLGLPYPGGPEIDRLAREGDPGRFPFSRSLLYEDGFSFSGLKTAVRNLLPSISEADIPDVCASFQAAVVEVLVVKTVRAAKREALTTIAAAGGVSCNTHLRNSLQIATSSLGLELLLPPPWLTTDNAVMIAQVAAARLDAGDTNGDPLDLDIDPNLAL